MSKLLGKIDSMPPHKVIVLFGVIPAILFFSIIYCTNPNNHVFETPIFTILLLLVLIAISAVMIIVGLVVGLVTERLANKIRQAYTKHMARFIAEVLTHDDEIRKKVVDGIVLGLNEAMLKDSPVIIDLKQRIETLEQNKKETDQITSEKIHVHNQSDDDTKV